MNRQDERQEPETNVPLRFALFILVCLVALSSLMVFRVTDGGRLSQTQAGVSQNAPAPAPKSAP